MDVNGRDANDFVSNVSTALNDGTHAHIHEFTNFKKSSKMIQSTPDNNISISGTMDIGVNGNVTWET
jgi:hypothetical protein